MNKDLDTDNGEGDGNGGGDLESNKDTILTECKNPQLPSSEVDVDLNKRVEGVE